MNYCPLCKRESDDLILEKHHLKTKRLDKKEIELICKECHKTIHGLFKQDELRNPILELDCIEGILKNERFIKAVRFIKKVVPGTYMKMKESKHRKK